VSALSIQCRTTSDVSIARLLHYVQPGNFIDITKFEVRWANRLNGDGKVIHLAVQDCELLRPVSMASWIWPGVWQSKARRVVSSATMQQPLSKRDEM